MTDNAKRDLTTGDPKLPMTLGATMNALLLIEHGCEQGLAGRVAKQFETKCAEIAAMKKVLEEIQRLVHTPSNGRHAYTHFMADFDAIRKICRAATGNRITSDEPQQNAEAVVHEPFPSPAIGS